MIRLEHRIDRGGVPTPLVPGTETPRPSEPPPSTGTEGAPSTARTEERHGRASTRLSGAGSDLAAVTGTTGVAAPVSDARARFERDLARFEGLRRTSPDEARRMLPSLRSQASELLGNLPAQPRELLDLMRLVRGFYCHARDLATGAEADQFRSALAGTDDALRTVRTWLRSTLVVPSGGHATASQRASARLAIDISRELAASVEAPAGDRGPLAGVNDLLAVEVIADYRTLIRMNDMSSMDDRPRVEDAAVIIRELYELRRDGLNDEPLSSALQTEVTSMMRGCHTTIHNSFTFVDTPHAHDYLDQLFSDIIDSDDGELISHLSADGLERYVREEGPHAAFSRSVRRLTSRIGELGRLEPANTGAVIHDVVGEIRRLEANIDPNHLVDDLLAIRELYQRLGTYRESPWIREHPDFAAVRPGFERAESLLRSTRDILRTGVTGDASVRDRIHMAELSIRISRGLGETTELIADYRRYVTLLNNAPIRDLDGADRVDAYCRAVRALYDLRHDGFAGHDLTSAQQDQVTSIMREAATEIHNSLGYIETPGTHAVVDRLLSRIIDGDETTLVTRLSASGLEEYTRGMRQAEESLTRARAAENPAEARTLMAESLRLFISLNAADRVHEVTDLILASVPADASDLSRLQVLTVLSSLLHGTGYSDEARVREAGSALAERLATVSIAVENIEYDVEDRPGGGSRAIEVGRTMVNPRGRIETAERILAARAFYSAIGDAVAASGSDERLGELQDAMATQLDGTTDRRLRIELAAAIVGLDQVLVTHSLSEAEDSEDRIAVGAGLRTHLNLWQREIEAARDLPADFRLSQIRSVLGTAASYRSLTEGDRAAMAPADLEGVNGWASRTIASLAETTVSTYVTSHELDAALTPRVMEDFRARVTRAVSEGDSAWLNGINEESIGQFTERSIAAHTHLTGRGDPPTAADLEHYLQASAVFASLGLPDRVRESLRPVIAHADGMTDAVPRANLYLNLGTLYQEAGMTEEANTMLGRIREMSGPDSPRELRRMAEVVPAMQELNLGHVDRARELLRAIHGNPRAEGLLRNIDAGISRRRALQSLDIARAAVSDYISWSRDRGSSIGDREERAIMAVYERAQRLVLAGRYDSMAEAMRHMDTTALLGFYDWSGGSNLDAFLRDTSDVSMTDDAFADRSLRLARSMFYEERLSSAGALASMLTGTPHTRDRAQALIDSIPGEARFNSIFTITNIPIIGGILLNTGGDRAVGIAAVRDFATLATFGGARYLALGAESMFLARVGTSAASSLMVRSAGFVIRSGTEAAAFTLSNMAMESLFTGSTDHWTFGNFMRQFGAMMVTFGLCHGIGMGVGAAGRVASRSSFLGTTVVSAEGTAIRVLRPGAQLVFTGVGYGATVVGLTGVEYLNEALGLHPHEGDVPFFTRLLGSALMDAQMRLAGHLTNGLSGGRLRALEESNQRRYLIHSLLPVMEHMGFERPERGREMSPESQVVMAALLARVGGGESVASLTERARSSEADLNRTVRIILDVPPESAEGRRMRALLYAYSGSRGAEFPPGSERLSQEVGRIRMEAGRSLRALGVPEGPEYTRLQNALVERMLSARVRETIRGEVRLRGVSAEEVAGMAEDARGLRGPLEGVVREVLGARGLNSREGRGLVGDLYVWMLETGRPITEARTEAIRRLVAEATRPAGSEAPPSASGSGLTGSLGNMVRGASEETRRLGRDFGLGETVFAGRSVMESAVRPFLEGLFNNPDSPPTAARIRARLSEVRSILEAANTRIGETIPAESQATLREEIFVEVLNGRMTREQALARVREAAPREAAAEPPPLPARVRRGGAEPPPIPMAARDGAADIRPPRVGGAEAPPAIPERFSTSDGLRYTVSVAEVSGPALNPGEVALRGPSDLANRHGERSTPETRRRLAAAMAFARAQGIPRSERRFILTEDNQIQLEINRDGTRRRVRFAEEIPDLTAHARPEPPVIPDLTPHARPEPPPIPDLTAHAVAEPPPVPRGARVPDMTAHAVPEVPGVEGIGRLEGGSLHIDFAGRSYGEVRVNDQTLIFHGAGDRVRVFNFTGEPLRVRHADGTTSEPISAARGPRGEEAGVAPGVTELRAGDVILLANGAEIPYGGATHTDTIRRATSLAPEGRSEEGTRRARRPRGETESPSESGTRRVRGPGVLPGAGASDLTPRDPFVDGRLQLDFRDRIYHTVALDGSTLTFGRRGATTQLYNFTGGDLRVRHADGTLSEPVAPPRARAGEPPTAPGSIEVRAGDTILLPGGREVPLGEALIRPAERETVPPPARVRGGDPAVVEGAGGEGTRRVRRPGEGPPAEPGEGTRPAVVVEVRTPRGTEGVEAPVLAAPTARTVIPDAPLALEFNPGADGNPIARSGTLEFTVTDGELHVRAREGSVRVAGREESGGRWVVVNEGDTVEIGGVHYARRGSTLRPIRLAASDAPVFAHGENGVIMENGDGNLTKVGGSVERNRQLDAEQAALAVVGSLGLDIAPPLVGRPDPSELIIGRIPGRSLASMTAAERRAIPDGAWTTFETALGRLREAGVHHNDMSAGNILWDGTTLRLIDFGMAEIGVRSGDDLSRVGRIREAIRAGRTGQDLYPLGSARDHESATRVPIPETPFVAEAPAPPPAEVPVAPVVPLEGRRTRRPPRVEAPAEAMPLAAEEGIPSTVRPSEPPPVAGTGVGEPPVEGAGRRAMRPPPGGAEIPVIPRPPRAPNAARLESEGEAGVRLMNATGEVGVSESLAFMETLATGLEHGSPRAVELAQRLRRDIRDVRAGGAAGEEAATRLASVASTWGNLAPGRGGRPRAPSSIDAALGDALVQRLEGSERGTRPPPRRRAEGGDPLPLAQAAEEGAPSTVRPELPVGAPPPEGGGGENTGVGAMPLPSSPRPARTGRPELFGMEGGATPRFLGYDVPRTLQEGLFCLITPREETPFVNFAEEGLRVALEGRNARREVTGFADFGHIVDRHAHSSTERGELRAGIYGENVDIEMMGRETVRRWDEASTSYDAEGRLIFILRRTYDAPIGVDSAGDPTRINQVIVSRDGEIISSFPVPAGGRGFVARSTISEGSPFQAQLLRAGLSPAITERHAPFLAGNTGADTNHLYLSDTPFGMVNQRTLATYRESLTPEFAGVTTTARAGRAYDAGDGTVVIDARGTRAPVLVAEMRFEDPIGVRRVVGPDGRVEETPLRWNRTYYVERTVTGRDGSTRTERTILGGHPIAEPSEPHLSETIWNAFARPRAEVPSEARAGGEPRRGDRDRIPRERVPRRRDPAPEPRRAPETDPVIPMAGGEAEPSTVRPEPPVRGAPAFGGPPPPPEGGGGTRETTGVGFAPRPSPRAVVGEGVIDSVRTHLTESGVRAEDIFEVSIDQREIQSTMTRLAATVPLEGLPRTIHAIANIRRADGTQVIGILTAEVSADGRGGREVRSHLDQSTFHFSYRITETPGSPARIRIILIEAEPGLRGRGVFNQATEAALSYARERHPGVMMETDGVNLLSAQRAGAMLPDARFMTITNPETHPIMRPLQTEFVDILERSEVLSVAQATELRGLIERLPTADGPDRNARRAELYNRFVEFVRENYGRHRGEAPNEVAFLFQRVRRREGLGFMSQDPFRRPVDADYISALARARVLTEPQATELREALARAPEAGPERDAALRTLRERFRTLATENFEALPPRRRDGAANVNEFILGRLETVPGAVDRFLPGPYRGDLWVEGHAPGGEVRPAPVVPREAPLAMAAADEAPAGGTTRRPGDPPAGGTTGVVPLPPPPVLANPERRADLARVIRAHLEELPTSVPDLRRQATADLAAVEAGTAGSEILGRYTFEVEAVGEAPTPRTSRYLSFESSVSGSERVRVVEVAGDGRSVTVERADGSRVSFRGRFPGPHAFRIGDSLSLISARSVAGGAGGGDLGTMSFASPAPGVFTCVIGRGAASREGYFALADSPHTGTISRRHVELRVEGGNGTLTDLGGPNGTRVWDGASRTWRRLGSGERYSLRAGETFRLGGETFSIERAPDGNYRLRVHGEGREVAAAPLQPAVAGRSGPEVAPVRVAAEAPPEPSAVAPLDFSRGAVILGSFRGREVPTGAIQIVDRRISREHAVLNPAPGGGVVIEARPDTAPAVLRGDREVTPVWVRRGETWVMLGSAEHPERSHHLRPGEEFALGTDPRTDARGRRGPDANEPLIFTVGPDGRSISSPSEFHDAAVPVRERGAPPPPDLGVPRVRRRVIEVGEEAPAPLPPPGGSPPPDPSAPSFSAARIERGGVSAATVVGDPIAELASLPAGSEVFVALRGGQLVVERGATAESVIAVRRDARGALRVRSTSGSATLLHSTGGGEARSEPLVGHTGSVLRPGQNVIVLESHMLTFSVPGAAPVASAPPPMPVPGVGTIGRGLWSVPLPDAPAASRLGIRLNDLAESTSFLDLYMGDPALGPSAAEPGVAQLTLADPLGGSAPRHSLGRLERTPEGWVLHPPRGRDLTISRPDLSRPNAPGRDITLRRGEGGARLRDGDRIDFGGALEFEFRNGRLIPAITGDISGRLVVPDQAMAAGEAPPSVVPSSFISNPPPPYLGTGAFEPILRDGSGREMRVPLTEPGLLVIGRDGDLRIGNREDPASPISGRHATLRMVIVDGERVYQVRDGADVAGAWQPSLNGSFVNGERVRSGEWRTVRTGDRLRLGPTEITWHAPSTAGAPIGHETLDFARWQQMNPELLQARQFVVSNYLDGAPADRLEIPGRSAVYMEGAGRFVEGAEAGGREVIVWDRSRDTEVSAFLGTVEGEVRTRLGISRLDPASPTFERDLGRALDYFVGRLRETYRVPGEDSRAAMARLDAFARAHVGEPVLVGEVLRARLPFCRHLTLLTQAFLTDLGLRGEMVRMQRGSVPTSTGHGAHVWNEVVIGGRRRIVEPTWAFYSASPTSVLMPSGTEVIYQPESRAGRVER